MSPRYSQSPDNRRPANGQPAEEDGRSFTTGIGSMVDPADEEAPPPPPPPAAPAQPTFTARPDGPATAVPEPAFAPDDAAAPDSTLPDAPALGPDDGAPNELAAVPAADLAAEPAPPAGPVPAGDAVPGAGPVPVADPAPGDDLPAADEDRTRARPLPTTAGLDEPLLSDADGLRTRWQRVQAGFVDDPQEAVGEAADLIEQTAQAMVGALRQRQRQLRVMWESGAAGGPLSGNAAPGDDPVSGDSPVPGDGATGARGQDTEHLRQMMRHYRALFNQLCRP
jgi:hypothetical protein